MGLLVMMPWPAAAATSVVWAFSEVLLLDMCTRTLSSSSSSSSYSIRTAQAPDPPPELVSSRWSPRALISLPLPPSCLSRPAPPHTQHPPRTASKLTHTTSQSSSCPRTIRRWCWSRGGRAWWARGSRSSSRLVRVGKGRREGEGGVNLPCRARVGGTQASRAR